MQERKTKNDFYSHKQQQVQDCFKLMYLQGKKHELFVPSCVQFKIRNFTSVNFDNLIAQVNGVLCINFLIFTKNEQLKHFLEDRLYFNPEEQLQLEINRRKKMDRGEFNYIPVMFNKDINVKIPTTRTKQFQIQSFKSKIKYKKNGTYVEGVRIFHIIRKEFNVEIKKSTFLETFVAPFNFINLELVVTLEHMLVGKFKFKDQRDSRQRQIERGAKTEIRPLRQVQARAADNPAMRQEEYMRNEDVRDIKKISFNLMRIEEPYRKKMDKDTQVKTMAPMIAYSCEESYGKYDVVETELQAYTHDQRQLKQWQSQQAFKKQLFQDIEPTQLNFKPFKYAVFKIPMFRYPIVDMMTIFIPLWLLSFVSIYIYFQTTEIITRIVNVAALMIAYAAIQPIVRENLPEATSITFVDVLIYSQLVINILFIVSSISHRDLFDAPDSSANIPTEMTNAGYSRWSDPYFIASFIISIINVIAVLVLIIIYLCKKGGYKAIALPKITFQLSDKQNWTLTLMMDRNFARYKQKLMFIR